MNTTIQRIFEFCFIIFLFYFLVWPFINSATSSKYFIKTATAGSSGESYSVELNKEGDLSVNIAPYNDIATDTATSDSTESYKNTLSEETTQKLTEIIDSYKSYHIFVRQHAGYVFWYNSTGGGAALFQNSEREKLLQVAQIAEKLARGDEKISGERITYQEQGEKELKSLYKEIIGLE